MATPYPLLAIRGLEATDASFREQLVAGAQFYGLDPGLLAAVMAFESGFNPGARNDASGALGLIQWISDESFADTARAAGMPNLKRSDLPKLTATEQLPLVFAWFENKPIGLHSTPLDYYMAVWSPAYIGDSPDYVVARKGSKVYDQNSGFDKTKKGYFTVADVGAPVQALVTAAQGRAPIPVPLVGMTPRATLRSPGGGSSLVLPRPPRSPGFSDAEKSQAGLALELPTLRRGSQGPAIRLLQQLLNLTSGEEQLEIHVDGVFGDETETAVGMHQLAHRLDPDGVCGASTWKTFADDETWSVDRIGRDITEKDVTV